MKLATADFTRVSILLWRPAATVRGGGGDRGPARRGAGHAGCGGRRAAGARAAGPLGRAARLPEPRAAGGRARASRAGCCRLPPLHFRNGEAWSGPAGQGETPRARGAAGRPQLQQQVPSLPAALDSCVSRTETTGRARGAGTAAATVTAAVESCDNQAARALAAAVVAGAQPLPCRPERG